MKNILYFSVVALLLCLIGCRHPESAIIMPKPKSDPVDFVWIKSSEEIKLAMFDIYFHGTADGKYVSNGKWVGKITGSMFFKPMHSKSLTDGLFIENCTVQVNEDCSIKIAGTEKAFFSDANKITFENGEVVVWYDNNTFKFKGGSILYSKASGADAK